MGGAQLPMGLDPLTLNPQPSTPNPQPSTLNPQPSTQVPTGLEIAQKVWDKVAWVPTFVASVPPPS